MKRVLLLALLLAGCSSPAKPAIEIRTVRVPVSVPCATDIPAKQPREGDTVDLKADVFDLVKAALVDLARAEAENVELRARLHGCVLPKPDS